MFALIPSFMLLLSLWGSLAGAMPIRHFNTHLNLSSHLAKEVYFGSGLPPVALYVSQRIDSVLIPNKRAMIIFNNLADMARILKQHYWRFKGVLVTVERWFVNANMSLIHAPHVWIKVLGIPIHAWIKHVFSTWSLNLVVGS
ncbi:hypothetical protein AMTRI_Chr03g45430 [Amborella trichopoda]